LALLFVKIEIYGKEAGKDSISKEFSTLMTWPLSSQPS